MIIEYKNIPCYYLSKPEEFERQKNIESMLCSLDMKFTKILADTFGASRNISISTDTIKLINTGIENNVFPFLWMEDDATLIDNLPQNIDIDEMTDLIYLGSTLHNHNRSLKSENILRLKIKNYNECYYKIINSLSCHAIVVPSLESANLVKKILKESIEKDIPHDVALNIWSRKKLFLTPKDGPFFYQNDIHNKVVSNFKWRNTSFVTQDQI